ncbi:UDP-N-acetylmuramate dehydrogenase [Luminiphilus sp.]|nr:UDP-N-acetylmuramate dehydrogenase [Luminiphilus sp.]MDA8985807.1 UDP-N-acetylmuramate dehydrogenase [Luminiphilus sp.]
MSDPVLDSGNLSGRNTLGLKAQADRVVLITDGVQLEQALTEARPFGPITLLGGGSNVVMHPVQPGTVLLMNILGRELRADDGHRVILRVGAGENWHELVLWCHHHGLHGLANLALIPGSVGAAPIQNIGAYGVEVSQFIRAVHVMDRETLATQVLAPESCQFRYRDSCFKHQEGAQWIITAVDFQLDRNAPVCLEYPALKERLSAADPTHDAVLAGVMSLRQEKLPDPVVTPNVGSFFKNPVLSQEEGDALRNNASGVPLFAGPQGGVKVPAAWLIDQLGWRGVEKQGVKVSDAHALVLVGCGAQTAEPWLTLAADIVASVESAFGLTLELEPRVLGHPEQIAS